MKHFYERNDYILNHEINKNFEEILWMNDIEFRQWVIDMRKVIAYAWDELGIPPRVGFNEDQIIDQFNKLDSFPVHGFVQTDEVTGEKDVIRNTSVVGNAANQWFPTMMATKINYKNSSDGLSIYDHFVRDDLLEKVTTYSRRHFKRDSFYHYSLPVKARDQENFVFYAETGAEWIEQFEQNERQYNRSDYWLCPKKEDAKYTGYNEKLKNQTWLTLTKDEIESINIPEKCKTNVDYDKSELYQIRYFSYGQKLFPLGLKAFRISWCQYAVNFPPLTAKYLYETYTESLVAERKDDSNGHNRIVIYDPSSGWGGRILGAMCVRPDRSIHYIGTDPNTDHVIDEHDGIAYTKYEDLATFYNEKTYRTQGLFPKVNTYELFQDGSEVISRNEKFQEYKGKVDLVFTSPPYFAKEAYSQDETQSYKKFGEYDEWRDGFLVPTLETCVEWLAHERYLLWNISDVKFGKDMLPLAEDSQKILESLGMKFVKIWKMSMAQMPGANRLDPDTGLPMAKYSCKVKDIWLKYEPIFVYYKP